MKKLKKTLYVDEWVYLFITIFLICISVIGIKNEIRFARDGYIVQGTITNLDWKPLGGHYSSTLIRIPITVEYVDENGKKKITKGEANSRYHILDYVPGEHVNVRVLRSESGQDTVTYLNDTGVNIIIVTHIAFEVLLIYLFFKVYTWRRK